MSTTNLRANSQLHRFFSMLWIDEKGKVQSQIDKLSKKEVSEEGVARSLFKSSGDPEFIQFLRLLAEKDQSAVWLVVLAKEHNIEVDVATEDALDIIEHLERCKQP